MKSAGKVLGGLLVIGISSAALVYAVLMPDKAPEWLRELTRLGEGDETAATPWVRWALVAVVVAALLLARLWGQSAWVDVALVSVAFLTVFAVLKQHDKAAERTVTEAPETTRFTLPMKKLVVERDLAPGSDVIVLIVEPQKEADDEPLTYLSTRYEATVPAAVTHGATTDSIDVAVKRGEKDANVVAFSGDLAGATTVYLLPGPKKKPAER